MGEAKRKKGATPQAHCHRLVAFEAMALAHVLFDRLMRDDRLYAAWKAQNEGATLPQLEELFVARTWPSCIEVARATLAAMLATPLDPEAKELIYEALVLDKGLVRGRQKGPPAPSTHPMLRHLDA